MPDVNATGEIVVKCLRCGWFVLRGRFEGTVDVRCTNNGCGTDNVVSCAGGSVTVTPKERSARKIG